MPNTVTAVGMPRSTSRWKSSEQRAQVRLHGPDAQRGRAEAAAEPRLAGDRLPDAHRGDRRAEIFGAMLIVRASICPCRGVGTGW